MKNRDATRYQPLLYNTKMPTPRKKFAHSLAPNRKGAIPLTEIQRQSIIQEVLNGVQYKVLALRFGCHRNTIRNTFVRWKEQHNFYSRPRPGIKPRLNSRQRRLLVRYIRNNPARPWGEILLWCESTFGKKVSRNTVRRILKRSKLGHWRSCKRIFLNKVAIIQRNRFWRHWFRRELELTQVVPPPCLSIYPANCTIIGHLF